MKAEFDPVTLATPFFILSIILEIVLARMGKADRMSLAIFRFVFSQITRRRDSVLLVEGVF